MKSAYQGRVGIVTIFTALFAWTVERTTQVISTAPGKLFCGDRYMKPVDGIVGDPSCGFNTDMYLSLSLAIIFVLGLVLYILSKKQAASEQTH